MKKYQLEVNETQLRIIEQALEVLSRIGTKQYHIALEQIETKDTFGLGYETLQILERIIRKAEELNMPNNASYGIHSPEISDKFRVAWDMIQVFRYVRSWANAEHKPKDRDKYTGIYSTINFNSPMKSSEQSLPKCEEIK